MRETSDGSASVHVTVLPEPRPQPLFCVVKAPSERYFVLPVHLVALTAYVAARRRLSSKGGAEVDHVPVFVQEPAETSGTFDSGSVSNATGRSRTPPARPLSRRRTPA